MKWTWETKLQNYISYYTACCAPEVLCNVGQDKMDLCLILYFYISNELLILFSRQKNKNDLWSYMEAKGVLRIWWWLLFHVLPKMCNVVSFVILYQLGISQNSINKFNFDNFTFSYLSFSLIRVFVNPNQASNYR